MIRVYFVAEEYRNLLAATAAVLFGLLHAAVQQ
jgi:hypothetical protein